MSNETDMGALPGQAVDEAKRQLFVTIIRCRSIELLLAKNEFDAVGCALRSKLISIEAASQWLDDLGASDLVKRMAEFRHD